MDWIQKTGTLVKKRKIEFNTIKDKISEWLKDLKEVFETILKKELPSSYKEVNYEITLKTNEIKSLSLISIRSEKQYIVKKYLDQMLRKDWIRVSKLLIVTFLFLIFKLETKEKRLVINYRKLNKKTVTDSTSLSLIKDMMN